MTLRLICIEEFCCSGDVSNIVGNRGWEGTYQALLLLASMSLLITSVLFRI